MRLILASRSPRRADLLAAAGIEFETCPVDTDESRREGEAPAAYVARLAREKANAAASTDRVVPILGADTIVLIDGQVLGKPDGDEDAVRMLRLLSGRTHEVLTGVAIRVVDRLLESVDSTQVRFVSMTAGEIDWYVATGEPHDKAGAYAIQGHGSRFIDHIAGSYTNVVGLPVATVYRLLHEAVSTEEM